MHYGSIIGREMGAGGEGDSSSSTLKDIFGERGAHSLSFKCSYIWKASEALSQGNFSGEACSPDPPRWLMVIIPDSKPEPSRISSLSYILLQLLVNLQTNYCIY